MWFDSTLGIVLRAVIPASFHIFYWPWWFMTQRSVKQEKYRKFVFIFMIIEIILGSIVVGIGIFALVTKQPWFVWSNFISLGALWVFLVPGLYYFNFKKMYAQAELNKKEEE